MSSINTALKRSALALAFAAGLAVAGFSGAAEAGNVRVGIAIGYAPYAPPQSRHEYIPRHQSRYDVWQPGHWQWTGHRYRWVPGHYIRAPYRGARWQDGRWDHRGNGYAWTDGRWDNRRDNDARNDGRWDNRRDNDGRNDGRWR